MITTANYIVKVRPQNGETYIFEYETPDVWTALEELWHDDWDNWLSDIYMDSAWPIDVYAMEHGKVIRVYKFKLCTSFFHAYFDHGRLTLDEFAKFIERKDGMTIHQVCDQIAEFTGDKRTEAMRKAKLFRQNCCVPLKQVTGIRLMLGCKKVGNLSVYNHDTLHFVYSDSDGDKHQFSILD